MRSSAFAIVLLLVWAGTAWSADFYVWKYLLLDAGKPSPTWRNLTEDARLQFLSQDRAFVEIRGPLASGDNDELVAIHQLVPIVTLHISSNGGSVAEALKISAFVNKHAIRVETDIDCSKQNSSEPGRREVCGCASACALIWLSAPDRAGTEVRMHRPYFAKDDFPNLPDDVALNEYQNVAAQVRSLLHSKGFSQDFIASLFRTPRESARKLGIEEIANLPIDVGLDELLRARCYKGNETQLAERSAINDRLRIVGAEIANLLGTLPNKPGADLERDPFFSEDYAKLNDLWREQTELRISIDSFREIHDRFSKCVREERESVALRRGGERLSDYQRRKLAELAGLVALHTKGLKFESFTREHIPDDKFTAGATDEIGEREQKIRSVWGSIEPTLPNEHKVFLLNP